MKAGLSTFIESILKYTEEQVARSFNKKCILSTVFAGVSRASTGMHFSTVDVEK